MKRIQLQYYSDIQEFEEHQPFLVSDHLKVILNILSVLL